MKDGLLNQHLDDYLQGACQRKSRDCVHGKLSSAKDLSTISVVFTVDLARRAKNEKKHHNIETGPESGNGAVEVMHISFGQVQY